MKFYSGAGKKERKARFSMLEKGMIVCLALTLVSSMFFVGTTLSWFSDEAAAGGTVINTGDFSARLAIDNGLQAELDGSSGVQRNVIRMKRADKNSEKWEPGAVFISDAMYVENTGDMDLEYRLELLTNPVPLLEAALESDTADAQSQQTEQTGLRLLDVIDFKIVDEATLQTSLLGAAVSVYTAGNGAAADNTVADAARKYFNENVGKVDLRAASAEEIVASTDGGNQILKLAAGDETGSAVSTYSADTAASQSGRFYIVGRMRDDAGNEYKNLTLQTPFVLVVRSQQSGSEWTAATTELCSDEKHQTLAENAVPFQDADGAFWRCEADGAHAYYCADCEQQLLSVSGADLQTAHDALAADPEAHGGSVWKVRIGSDETDYYCRICAERIAVRR